MVRTLPLLALAGCPYLFQEPDLSNVPCRHDCGTTPTPTPTDASSAPEVVQFEVTPRSDAVVVHLALADLDGDLVGGSVDLSDGSQHWVLAIPGDLDDWQPLGTSTTTLYRGTWLDCSTTVDEPWTLTPTDHAGNVGQAGTTELVVTAVGLEPEEGAWPNVWPDGAHTVGVSPPFVGCVTYAPVPGDVRPVAAQLKADVEGVNFGTPDPGDYRVQLWWSAAFDVDMFVYPLPLVDQDSDGYYDIVGESLNFGTAAEEVVFPGIPGDSWFADFPFYQPLQSQSPPFQAQFLVTPD